MYNKDSISDYLKEIRKYPLLTFEEEIELSQRIQKGDLTAQKKLIESNLRLVVTVARKYAASDFPLLDIIQEGNLGLITAAQKYEFSYNVRFSTYACWWIQQSITRAIANKRRMIRLPFRKEELAGRVRRTSAELFQRLSRNPSREEIAEEMNLPVQDISDIMFSSGAVTSLDLQLDEEDSASLKDLIADSTWNPEDIFMRRYSRECMLEALSELKETEREIMLKRYNLDDSGKTYTLKNIGAMYGVSAETVRQVELRALRKLRGHSEDLREIMYG